MSKAMRDVSRENANKGGALKQVQPRRAIMRLGDGEQDAQSPVAAGQDHAGVDQTDEQDERIRTSAPGEQAEEGGIKPVDGDNVHDTGAKGQDHANGRSRHQLNEQAAIEKGI